MKLQPAGVLALGGVFENVSAYMLIRRAPFIAVQMAAMTRNGSTLRVL